MHLVLVNSALECCNPVHKFSFHFRFSNPTDVLFKLTPKSL